MRAATLRIINIHRLEEVIMRRAVLRVCALLGFAIAIAYGAEQAAGCTGLRLKAADGAIVYGRTLEFGIECSSAPIIIPRHFAMQGSSEGGRPGLAWKAKYAAVGLNGLGLDRFIDGVNEKGLAGGVFYMPGYAKYQAIAKEDDSRTLGPWELITWILTSFSSVDEVRSAVEQVRVGAVPAPMLNFVPPTHFVVHDAGGKSLVIEYLQGQLRLYDNPIGVITNSPEFSWHMTNLNNYVNLRALNAAPVKVDGVQFQPLSQGSGLFGIPGDYTSPARFVRVMALGRTALPGQNGEEAIAQLFHVLNAFDIPRGSVVQIEGGEKGYELTQWTCGSDLKNRTFCFHTHDNRRVRRIELMKADLDSDHVLTFPAQSGPGYEDLKPETKRQ
jgi:choloylglycine hydrolase